jgi:hypothetical protein
MPPRAFQVIVSLEIVSIIWGNFALDTGNMKVHWLHPLADSGDCANVNTSGAVDWRCYNDPLEIENRTLQAR